MLKRPVKENGRPPCDGEGGWWKPTPFPAKHLYLLNGAPFLYTGMCLPNAVQSK